jgi:ABC-type transporter Mla maintaining outer membrane lipid asymmetry ATPase subunit MlaF
MLAGLTKPLEGCYKMFGDDMGQHFGDESLPNRLRLGMVFDDSRLLSNLTFAENIALPARYHHNLHAAEASSWAELLLRAIDAAEFAHSKPSAVARPWRQRAALARALALKPEVLLLENPLRGMDARHTVWWVTFIQKLARGHDLMSGKPMTIVLSTDEFWPWRNLEAQFATLHERRFETAGKTAPEEESQFARAAEGEEI